MKIAQTDPGRSHRKAWTANTVKMCVKYLNPRYMNGKVNIVKVSFLPSARWSQFPHLERQLKWGFFYL